MSSSDTIAAIATPPGRGGVCIIRVSGPLSREIAVRITGKLPRERYAQFCRFKNSNQVLDEGLALFFSNPDSFTGEDVLELHGHGGMVVSDMILQAVLESGARMARPGEFSERAFLNDKLDLTQAEAIADLIDAGSQQAARAAVRTLEGEFSDHINVLQEELTELRIYVESALDFAEEEIELLKEGDVEHRIGRLLGRVRQLYQSAQRGRLLSEGLHIAIAGKPNAGKSSLMNYFCGRESAIVTDMPGTTRDVLREQVVIQGIPVHVHDTAGLRDHAEPIEHEGIRRARDQIDKADLVLWVHDATTELIADDFSMLPVDKSILVLNKIDLTGDEPGIIESGGRDMVRVSVNNSAGLEDLVQLIARQTTSGTVSENEFSARRRHLLALQSSEQCLLRANQQLGAQMASFGTGELLAEELRLAQQYLGEITGKLTADDLLGKIFTEFCIGK